jgi:hypothetical protein
MNQELFITPDHTFFVLQPVPDGFQVSIQKNHERPNEGEPLTHYVPADAAEQLRFNLLLQGAQQIA